MRTNQIKSITVTANPPLSIPPCRIGIVKGRERVVKNTREGSKRAQNLILLCDFPYTAVVQHCTLRSSWHIACRAHPSYGSRHIALCQQPSTLYSSEKVQATSVLRAMLFPERRDRSHGISCKGKRWITFAASFFCANGCSYNYHTAIDHAGREGFPPPQDSPGRSAMASRCGDPLSSRPTDDECVKL